MEESVHTISRIPRPKGFSSLISPTEKYEAGARHMLAAGYGFGMRDGNITAAFRRIGIPTHVWRKEVVDGLAAQLDEKKLLTGGLYHLSLGTTEIDDLSVHLSERILNDGGAHPILVKEYNSLISNRTRLAEAFIKLGQAMKETEIEDGTEQKLSHAQIVEILVDDKQAKNEANGIDVKVNPLGVIEDDMIKDIEGTPELEPIPMSLAERPGGEKEKPKALPTQAEVVIAPQ